MIFRSRAARRSRFVLINRRITLARTYFSEKKNLYLFPYRPMSGAAVVLWRLLLGLSLVAAIAELHALTCKSSDSSPGLRIEIGLVDGLGLSK